jgi:hypothetical protein
MMSNNDEWVSVNGHLDHGTGFIHAGIADDIEQRFGVFPSFGYAGGCVNMVLRRGRIMTLFWRTVTRFSTTATTTLS